MIYVRRTLLILLTVCFLEYAETEPVFPGPDGIGRFLSRGLSVYYLADDEMGLIGPLMPAFIFNTGLYNTKNFNDGTHFYFPCYSKKVDNSSIGFESESEYKNYYFFLNKRNVTGLADFFTQRAVPGGSGEGRQFFLDYRAGKHIIKMFLADNDVISGETENEFVFSFFKYGYESKGLRAYIKREFLENIDDSEYSLYSAEIDYGRYGAGIEYLRESSDYEAYLLFTAGGGPVDVRLYPLLRNGTADVNAELKYGDFYLRKQSDRDFAGGYETSYYEIGYGRNESGCIYMRYADNMEGPVASYENEFFAGVKYELPVKVNENLMLLSEADLIFSDKHNGLIRSYIIFDKYLFKGDLNIRMFLRNNVITPSEYFDGYDYFDLYAGVGLVNTQANISLKNLFHQRLYEDRGGFTDEMTLRFSLTWFFYN